MPDIVPVFLFQVHMAYLLTTSRLEQAYGAEEGKINPSKASLK